MDGPLDAAPVARRAPEGCIETLSLRDSVLRLRRCGDSFTPAQRFG